LHEKETKGRDEIKEQVAELKSQLEVQNTSSDKGLEDLKSERERSRAVWLKYRMYLLARISDYSKELEFWRATIRKIILSGAPGKDQAQATIAIVTKSQRTFGTGNRADDQIYVDSVLELARLLTKPENVEQDRDFEEITNAVEGHSSVQPIARHFN
jgi:hypothetical protein